MVVCREQGADLHMAQLMPLPLTVSWFSKIQIGFTFLVPAYPGSPGQRVVKWVCVLLYTGWAKKPDYFWQLITSQQLGVGRHVIQFRNTVTLNICCILCINIHCIRNYAEFDNNAWILSNLSLKQTVKVTKMVISTHSPDEIQYGHLCAL